MTDTIGQPKLCPLTFSIVPTQSSSIAGPGRTQQLAPVWYKCCREACEYWVEKTNVNGGYGMCARTLEAIQTDNIASLLHDILLEMKS